MELMRKADGELADADEEVFAAALVLMPPSIERRTKWLVVTCHAADGLPAMDEASSLGLYGAGIDAYAEVSFSGNPPIRTQWVTRRGAANLGVEWNRELWLPFNYPNFTNRIEVAIMDFDRFKENDRVGTIVLNFRDLDSAPLPLAWWPVYGAPDRVFFGRFKNRMNRLPTMASNYRGRVLLSARVEDTADNKDKDEVHWRPAVRVPRELMPPLAVYRLRALIIAGDELPTLAAGTVTGRLGLTAPEYGISVTLAGKTLDTPRVRVERGQAQWNALLECDVMLPVGAGGLSLGLPSPAPMPDTFIYLFRGDPTKDAVRICYARLNTAELLARGLAGSVPYWQPLREDIAVNAISDDDSAGSVLLRLGVGPLGEAVTIDWRAELRELEVRKPFELRVHVFQGRKLPAADETGALDPYLKVSIAGEQRLATKRYATTAPTWYETICMDVLLPPLRFANQVHVELWDWDEYTAHDFVSELRIDLSSPDVLISSARNLPPILPKPRWFRLTRLESKAVNDGTDASENHGELLLLVQLIAKDTRAQVVPLVPSTIIPPTRDMFLEIVALGCRDLQPFNFMQIAYPHVEFDVGDIGAHAGALACTAHARARVCVCVCVCGFVFVFLSAAHPDTHHRGTPPPPLCADAKSAKRKRVASARTVKSRYPTGRNPNFCERFMLPIKVPLDPLFAPSVSVTVLDNRLGGFDTPVVATSVIDLDPKIPWSPAYVPARGVQRRSSANPYDGSGIEGAAAAAAAAMGGGEGGGGGGAAGGWGGGSAQQPARRHGDQHCQEPHGATADGCAASSCPARRAWPRDGAPQPRQRCFATVKNTARGCCLVAMGHPA
ncbi:MAG: C2 domain-containing protein 3 [Burkholderiaceae bacterium]|nr:C2 domain-containing protein 3 [Burkholderiaceae bacterium]